MKDHIEEESLKELAPLLRDHHYDDERSWGESGMGETKLSPYNRADVYISLTFRRRSI